MFVCLFRNKVVGVLVAIVVATSAQAQHIVSTRNVGWLSVVFNYRFNQHWSLVNDALFRMETDGDIFQSGVRSGLQYRNTRDVHFTAGGCVFLHYSNPNGQPSRPELRTWQEAGRKVDFGIRHTLWPRIRFEQRFFKEYSGSELADSFTFHSYRLRFRLEYFYNIGDSGTQHWSLVAGDEIMFHRRGDGFTSHDQNRVWIGFGYKIAPAFSAQLTYMHIYQQRTNIVFDQFHVIRLTLQFTGKNHS